MNKIKLFFAIIIGLLILSCDSDDNDLITSKTDIELITGIVLTDEYGSQISVLGNPNANSLHTTVYPIPSPDMIRIVAINHPISNVWIRKAKSEKIYQQTDFSLILDSDWYTETEILTDCDIVINDINTYSINANIADLSPGYYKVFIKINGDIHWDNIYKSDSNFEIDDLINYWN